MDKLKKGRAPLRGQITRYKKEVEDLITADKEEEAITKFQVMTNSFNKLEIWNQKILDLMVDDDASTEVEMTTEMDANSQYQEDYVSVKLKVDDILKKKPAGGNRSRTSGGDTSRKSYNLPKYKPKMFSGEIKDWLSFWSQFRKIHEDGELDPSDKFFYLDQAMEPGSRAKSVVNAYPQTGDNYPKAIKALQDRFGREDLQVEVFVRELLKLVMNNVNQGNKSKCNLAKLYDDVESHLRSLESLNVTSDKYDAMLYPMVESCLPVPVMRAWQRSPLSKIDGAAEAPPKTKLHFFMEFLRAEVESEQRIDLASEGFGLAAEQHQHTSSEKKSSERGKGKPSDSKPRPTAAGLVNEERRGNCAFCSRGHDTKECGSVGEWSLTAKKDKLMREKCCYVCFRPGCRANTCTARIKCIICGRKHHPITCPELPSHQGGRGEPDRAEPIQQGNLVVGMSNQVAGAVILQTAMVKLVNGNKYRIVRALFDTGSQRSHILKQTAIDMGYRSVGEEHITHILFGGIETKDVHHSRFQITLAGLKSTASICLEALDQARICGRLPSVSTGSWMRELKDSGIWISDVGKQDEEIQVLIGGDYYGQLLTGKVKQLGCGITAVETTVGWTVMGRNLDGEGGARSHSMVTSCLQVSKLSVPDLWRLDTIGIMDPIDHKTKQEQETEVKRQFLETLVREPNGRYVVNLPWKCQLVSLPNNKATAESRLVSATRKLKTLGRYEDYAQIFEEWLSEGIIEEVASDMEEGRYRYLPHRPVIKEESVTTKVRPVFDASCKTGRAPSLNECLEKGPNLIDLIPAVMLRFRENRIGVISDIRKAFLMIGIQVEDRDVLRFLWWTSAACKETKVFRHKRVVFGVNSSPFLLGAVIQHHLSTYQDDRKEVAQKLQQCLYVDNCVTSVKSTGELENFSRVSTEMLAEAQMDLRMWQDSHNVKEEDEDRIVSVLGMKWDRYLDILHCDIGDPVELDEILTKRIILSTTQKIFDPLGILAPATLVPKQMLQETWAQKKGWDEEVSAEVKTRFLKWMSEMSSLKEIQVPRWMSTGADRCTWRIHTFCDACKYGYGAVVFLLTGDDTVGVQLLQAKARVAPLQQATIPRLELLACLIGARLTHSVCKALNLEGVEITYWSDSTTALAWIQRNDEWGTFVGNRVKEILLLSNAERWFHVPGKENPADLPSRGCSPEELLQSRWWEGPAWLKKKSSEWPNEHLLIDEEKVFSERKKSAAVNIMAEAKKPWYLLPNRGYLWMLKRSAYVSRFICNLRKREEDRQSGSLSSLEIAEGERKLVRLVQEEALSDPAVYKTLKVFKDQEGILRVKTRILMRKDLEDFRCPMLLPTSHPFVVRLIRDFHRRNSHGGAQVMISILREKFWIIHTRRSVKQIINSCKICRRFTAQRVEVEVAPLPENRVRDADPFEVVGVDCAGPLFLKGGKKVWIVLYTCAVYRAVHLELVTSMDTEHFLLSFRRFVSRRGRPRTVYCDNGTNFRGAANLLREVDWEKVKTIFLVSPIEWRFSPAMAPWWGGFWERLIRSVKGLLLRILGQSTVKYEELITILCDVESVVNQRPLTVINEDGDDLVALTPARFVQCARDVGIPELDSLSREGLTKRYRYRQQLMDELRSRFRKEYLGNLLDRAKQKPGYQLQVGDLVLIGEDFRKRFEWQTGKVEELIVGRDGNVRVAKIRTENGSLTTRPLQRLYPLELHPDREEVEPFMTRRGRTVKKPARYGEEKV